MQTALPFGPSAADALERPISPLLEMGAYEALWAREGMSFKKLAELFAENVDAMPSDLLGSPAEALEMSERVLNMLHERGVNWFGVRIHRAGEYPAKLRDARFPVELLYFQGWWNLTEWPSVAVVGTREPTDEGLKRARKLAR